ncbi:unnamed protein product [Cercospora beticola]|nr:unnamed protein product [Cercospora beticola]
MSAALDAYNYKWQSRSAERRAKLSAGPVATRRHLCCQRTRTFLPPTMATDTHQKSYAVGDILSLHTNSLDNAPRTLQAKIIQLYEPFTLSCVATVEINASDLGITDSPIEPAKAILKLYDRRFASQLRKESKIEPWTAATEEAYIDIIKNGEAAEFVRKLNDDSIDFEEPEEGWSTAENEA